MRSACIAAIGTLVFAVSASAQRGSVPDARAIDRRVRAQVDSGFSGVVLVATADSIILRRAYGAHRAPVSTGSAFWIASMTKGFTAAAVLALELQGRLSRSDSLARFFPDAPRDKRGITVHQLLTHTAGLNGDYDGRGIASRDEAVRAMLAKPLAYAPGKGYQYGDASYELLAAIVEIAAQRDWESVVETELLKPAALSHTGFYCRVNFRTPRAVPGADGQRTRCPHANAGARIGDWGHRGANGMSSTVDDLLQWSRALHASGPLRQVGRIMETPGVFVRSEPPAEVYYGYGMRVYTTDGRISEIMHSGSGDDGHTGIVRILPSGITVIVLSNAGQHAGTTWSSYVARQIMSSTTTAALPRPPRLR